MFNFLLFCVYVFAGHNVGDGDSIKKIKNKIGASWELNPGPLACFAVVRTPFIEASPGY